MKRRVFIQSTLVLTALAFLPKFAFAKAKELIDMSKKKRKDAANTAAVGVASGMNYVEDIEAALKAGKIKPENKPVDKMGVKAADQNCANCNFFNKPGPKECQLIAGVLVHDKGWCKTWMKKMG